MVGRSTAWDDRALISKNDRRGVAWGARRGAYYQVALRLITIALKYSPLVTPWAMRPRSKVMSIRLLLPPCLQEGNRHGFLFTSKDRIRKPPATLFVASPLLLGVIAADALALYHRWRNHRLPFTFGESSPCTGESDGFPSTNLIGTCRDPFPPTLAGTTYLHCFVLRRGLQSSPSLSEPHREMTGVRCP